MKCPLDFLGVGKVPQDAEDGEYIYKVNCNLDASGLPRVSYKENI